MQAAQTAHAAFQFAVEHLNLTLDWHDESSYLIVLGVPDEDALFDFADRMTSLGVPCSLMREPDIENQATALAIAPSEHWREFSSLPLLGKEVEMA
jgi:peptidyl-tRNA hydrolase